jgi:hypothetical protein
LPSRHAGRSGILQPAGVIGTGQPQAGLGGGIVARRGVAAKIVEPRQRRCGRPGHLARLRNACFRHAAKHAAVGIVRLEGLRPPDDRLHGSRVPSAQASWLIAGPSPGPSRKLLARCSTIRTAACRCRNNGCVLSGCPPSLCA